MKSSKWIGMLISVVLLFVIGFVLLRQSPAIENTYQEEWLLQHMTRQLENGPRLVGSESHDLTKEYIVKMLKTFEWNVIEQSWDFGNDTFTNIIGYDASCAGDGQTVIGAHYDSRIYADHDLDESLRTEPVMGANDGASGVAVLLDLARILEGDSKCNTSLVFFDAEDNGGIDDYKWIMGSRYFVSQLEEMPFGVKQAVILDMIGDADLNIYYERNSDTLMKTEIWNTAEKLGYNTAFIQEEKYSMLDDHTPFLEAGIPAVDVIDFDYEFWHTTQDTMDKVSIESLKMIVDVMSSWIEGQ